MTDSDMQKAIDTYTPANSIAATGARFDTLQDIVSKTLQSTASARVYGQTYRAWREWCDNAGVNYFDMTPGNVYEFLDSGDTSKATRQRQLSAMRKAAQMLVILDGDEARRLYEGLKVLKVPTPDKSKKRNAKRALTAAEVDAMLRQWLDTDALSRRNAAMLRLLVFTGLRRSEVAALRWQDIDLQRGIIHVVDGKGDKDRDAAIMDSSGHTVDALSKWRDCQPDGYKHVFVAVGRNGTIDADTPIADKTVARVVKATAKAAGIGDIAAHDLRRTHLTEYLSTGGTLAEAQEQAGHADGSTTLRYAQSVNAEARRAGAKFRFGAVAVPDGQE